MKEFYQIHELAKLFDLCPDTLRYYEEKGLLHPVRGENRYRMYGIQDVCTLNIIRSLRELDLPTREIGAYLERRSVGRPWNCWTGRRRCLSVGWRNWRPPGRRRQSVEHGWSATAWWRPDM